MSPINFDPDLKKRVLSRNEPNVFDLAPNTPVRVKPARIPFAKCERRARGFND